MPCIIGRCDAAAAAADYKDNDDAMMSAQTTVVRAEKPSQKIIARRSVVGLLFICYFYFHFVIISFSLSAGAVVSIGIGFWVSARVQDQVTKT